MTLRHVILAAAADTTDTAGATHQGAPITADIAHSTAVNAAPKNTPRL